jgi:hypothetical protein
MPTAGFKPTITASEQPQTHALDRAAIGTGWPTVLMQIVFILPLNCGGSTSTTPSFKYRKRRLIDKAIFLLNFPGKLRYETCLQLTLIADIIRV